MGYNSVAWAVYILLCNDCPNDQSPRNELIISIQGLPSTNDKQLCVLL